MCNLSEIVWERGIEIGRAEGRIEGKLEGKLEAEQESEAKMVKMIVNMYRRGDSEEEIAFVTEREEKEIREILAKNTCCVDKE